MVRILVVLALVGSSVAVSPVQKAVSLLNQLEGKVIKDGEAEQKSFEAYVDWCNNGAKDKEFEIKTAQTDIEELQATIDKATADIQTLSSKVEDLAASLSSNDADLKAASQIREKENAEFVAAEAELVDAINTVERAINILERKLHGSELLQAKVDRKDVKTLISTLSTIIDAAALTLHDKQRLIGLVQSSDDDGDDDGALGAPAPAAYSSKSSSIIDVLEDLKQKAESELDGLRRNEVNSRHNFELLKQSLEDQIDVDNKDLGASKIMKHEATETKAGAEGSLITTQKDLEEAQKVLKNMKGDCNQRAEDHEASTKSRSEELKAIAAARKALMEMTNSAADRTYEAASFLQLSGSGSAVGLHMRTSADLVNFEVVNLVRKLAREQKSAALAQLAGRISTALRDGAGQDPFEKIKGMISDMIERLEKEAGQEADHKAYCDKETAETSKKTAELNHDIDVYSSKIDKASAESVSLKDQVSVLQAQLAEIVRVQGEADALRREEHTEFLQAKEDLELGLEGVRLAMKVLRDYFASESAALLQQPEGPEGHEKAVGAGTGIIAMLEVVESDFGRNLATTEMEEEEAATAYQKLFLENKVAKAMKESDVKFKTKRSSSLDKAFTELTSDRDAAQTELDAVLKATVTIRGMCDLKPETYEDRQGRRESELAGLREALKILEGELVFLQGRNHRSSLRGAIEAKHL